MTQTEKTPQILWHSPRKRTVYSHVQNKEAIPAMVADIIKNAQQRVAFLPHGFSQHSERDGVAIYSDGTGRFWIDGQYFSSLQSARGFARSLARRSHAAGPSTPHQGARQILDDRYARGEISKEVYLQWIKNNDSG